jgi:hypothetical protein
MTPTHAQVGELAKKADAPAPLLSYFFITTSTDNFTETLNFFELFCLKI